MKIDGLSPLRRLGSRFVQSLDNKTSLLALSLIILVGLAVRAVYLSQPMRPDEADTYVNFASLPFFDILKAYSSTNNHILHTFFVAIATTIGGASPEVIRSPAFVFGVLMIPLVYLVACEAYDANIGILAAALTASSSCLIEYSANGRGYTLLIDLMLVALFYANQLRHDNDRAVWLALGLTGALGFFVSPIMLYPFGTVVMFLLLSIAVGDVAYSRSQAFKNLSLSCLLGALLTGAFYLPGFLSSHVFNQSHLQPMPLAELIADFPRPFIVSGYLWARDMPPLLIAVLGVMFLISIAFHRRLSRHKVSIILCIPVWLLVVTALYHIVPLTRVLLFILPLCIISLSSALVLVEKYVTSPAAMRNSTCAVSVALTIAMAYAVVAHNRIPYSSQTGIMRGAEDASRFIAANAAHADGIVFSPFSFGVMQYYLHINQVPFRRMAEADSDRLWVICNNNQEYAESLEGVLKEKRIGRPYTVVTSKTFEMATVYEIALQHPLQDHASGAMP